MEERQPMFNNLISIKRITLDRRKSRFGQTEYSPSKDSFVGSQESKDFRIVSNANE